VPRILKWYREREVERHRSEVNSMGVLASPLTMAQIRMGAGANPTSRGKANSLSQHPSHGDPLPSNSSTDLTGIPLSRKRKKNSTQSPKEFKSLFPRNKHLDQDNQWEITQSFLPKQSMDLVQRSMKNRLSSAPMSALNATDSRPLKKSLRPVEQQLKGCLCFIDIAGYSSMCNTLTQRATDSENNLLRSTFKQSNSSNGERALSRADSFTIVEMNGISSTVEEVARNINKYFASIMQLVRQFGGDVVKNGGDSLVCLFNDAKVSMGDLCLRAILCALLIQNKVPVYESDGIQLQLHIGITCGTFVSALVGGVDDAFEYVLLGQDAYRSLSPAVNGAKSGQIAVTERCLNELAVLKHPLQQYLTYTPLDGAQEARLVAWNPSITSLSLNDVIQNLHVQQHNWMPSSHLCTELKKLLPRSVCENIENNQTDFMADVRRISSVFINLSDCIPQLKESEYDSTLRDPTLTRKLQDCIESIQRILKQFDGVISQVLQDEKGLFVVGGFGIPPFFSKYDASRAVTASMNIHHALRTLNVRHSIGIASGLTYCGTIGDVRRQIMCIISHRVNLAARLMAHPKNHFIFCDETTKSLSEETIEYAQNILALKFKGIEQNLSVYVPTDHASYDIEASSTSDGNSFFKQYEKQRTIFKNLVVGRTKLFKNLEMLIASKKTSTSAQQKPVCPIVLCKGSSGSGKTEILVSTLKIGKELGFQPLYSHAVNIHNLTPFFIWKQLLSQVVYNYVHKDSIDDPEEFLQHYVQLLRNKIDQGSTYLVVIRSIHFVDEWSLRMILECIAQFQHRMIFVASSRNKIQDASKPLEEIVNMAEEFLIPKLSNQETQKIVCSICECADADPEIVKLVNSKSNSNLLFVEEIILNLLHSNIIAVVRDKCTIVDEKAFQKFVTPKLMDLLGSRFERMNVNLQLVCKVASCLAVDTTVRLAMLKSLFPVKKQVEQLDVAIQQLIEHNFIDLHNGDVIMFKDEAYQLLPNRRMLNIKKRQLHKAAAKWLQKNRSTLTPLKDTISAEIAFHMLRSIENGEKPDTLAPHAVEHLMNSSKELEEKGCLSGSLAALRNILTAIKKIPTWDPSQCAKYKRLAQSNIERLQDIMQANAILGLERVERKDFLALD